MLSKSVKKQGQLNLVSRGLKMVLHASLSLSLFSTVAMADIHKDEWIYPVSSFKDAIKHFGSMDAATYLVIQQWDPGSASWWLKDARLSDKLGAKAQVNDLILQSLSAGSFHEETVFNTSPTSFGMTIDVIRSPGAAYGQAAQDSIKITTDYALRPDLISLDEMVHEYLMRNSVPGSLASVSGEPDEESGIGNRNITLQENEYVKEMLANSPSCAGAENTSSLSPGVSNFAGYNSCVMSLAQQYPFVQFKSALQYGLALFDAAQKDTIVRQESVVENNYDNLVATALTNKDEFMRLYNQESEQIQAIKSQEIEKAVNRLFSAMQPEVKILFIEHLAKNIKSKELVRHIPSQQYQDAYMDSIHQRFLSFNDVVQTATATYGQ